MKNLPFWHLTNKYPSFQDVDSKTTVEMVAKVYGAMQELITEFNNLSEQLNKDFNIELKELEDFKICITELIENYIKMLDDKILLQDKAIQDTIKAELSKIKAVGVYDEVNETIDITLSYEEETNNE